VKITDKTDLSNISPDVSDVKNEAAINPVMINKLMTHENIFNTPQYYSPRKSLVLKFIRFL